ncbi:MAG TPA: hypothetical protein VK436_12900 [Methanocella sp.]|nr:hypothetical protein [Methanocella sp.]
MRSSIIIKASPNDIWGILTNHNTWEDWSGSKLNGVTPGWIDGARMEWELGVPSRISGIIPSEFIEITSNSGMKTKIILSGKKRGTTEVIWDEDFSSSYISISDPNKKTAQIHKTLADLKYYVEKTSRIPRTNTKIATKQNNKVNVKPPKMTKPQTAPINKEAQPNQLNPANTQPLKQTKTTSDTEAKYAAEGKGKTKNTLLSAILSFIIPGSGQIYNGQIIKGVIIFLTFLLTFITCICPIIVWLYGIYDAFSTSVKINKGEM